MMDYINNFNFEKNKFNFEKRVTPSCAREVDYLTHLPRLSSPLISSDSGPGQDILQFLRAEALRRGVRVGNVRVPNPSSEDMVLVNIGTFPSSEFLCLCLMMAHH